MRLPVRSDHEAESPRPDKVGAMRMMWRLRTDCEVAVVCLGEAGLDELCEKLGPMLGGVAGVSPVVDGLAELGSARRLAELAMRTSVGDGPEIARLDRTLPPVLVLCQPELSRHLTTGVLGPVLALDPADREVLLGTLEAWLRCEGSAAGRRDASTATETRSSTGSAGSSSSPVVRSPVRWTSWSSRWPLTRSGCWLLPERRVCRPSAA